MALTTSILIRGSLFLEAQMPLDSWWQFHGQARPILSIDCDKLSKEDLFLFQSSELREALINLEGNSHIAKLKL